MEAKCGPFTFFSNFDSGNLAKVERVKRETDEDSAQSQGSSSTTTTTSPQEQTSSGSNNDIAFANSPSPDFEYNLWTTPDCFGTPYENTNRTWFYFGVKGCQAGKLLKFNIMNLNKQGKLYNQGMTTFVNVVPCRNKWERIRERPSCEIVDGNFKLSFLYRFPEQKNIVCYFAFCYPYSYEETQSYLRELDVKYKDCSKFDAKTTSQAPGHIYYHRELLCHSLDTLRVDLLTITSSKGMLPERELRFQGLFPDVEMERAHQFEGKKVFLLTSRVHPGETPSSYVFQGFLNFITREHDPRAAALRDRFVFKLVPLLNPDGVKRGHYRTDQRGVNLNRVYQQPSRDLHPSVYAVKTLVSYYQGLYEELEGEEGTLGGIMNSEGETGLSRENEDDLVAKVEDEIPLNEVENQSEATVMKISDGTIVMKDMVPQEVPGDGTETGVRSQENSCGVTETLQSQHLQGNMAGTANSNNQGIRLCGSDGGDGERQLETKAVDKSSMDTTCSTTQDEKEQQPMASEKLSKLSNVSVLSSPSAEIHNNSSGPSNVEKAAENTDLNVEDEMKNGRSSNELTNNEECKLPDYEDQVSVESSVSNLGCPKLPWLGDALEFYVDLHGHASKRGCFMYGNYIEDEEKYVQCLLFPKLISVNSAHFDFTACNFTERNMYSRDRRDGMSKEGSGRVAIYKMTGLPHCYTLECNYNCGRSTNSVPPATCDGGCATPPPPPGFPPRYTTEIYEEVGRAVAISALDMLNANPWSRLPNSEHGCVEGMKNWIYRYIRNSSKNGPAIQKKLQKNNGKSWSVIQSSLSTIRRSSMPKLSSSSNETSGVQNDSDTATQGVKSLERAGGTSKQRTSIQSLPNRKLLATNSTTRNQVGMRGKDQGRKRLDLTKTTPLLMLSNGEKNMNQAKIERLEKQQSNFMNFERHKSNVIKKLRDNLATMRMDGLAEETVEKRNKLQNIVSVRQLECTTSAASAFGKRDLLNESSTSKRDREKGGDGNKIKPIMRRRKTKRIIQKETNMASRELVDVKTIPGSEVTCAAAGKNSSKMSL